MKVWFKWIHVIKVKDTMWAVWTRRLLLNEQITVVSFMFSIILPFSNYPKWIIEQRDNNISVHIVYFGNLGLWTLVYSIHRHVPVITLSFIRVVTIVQMNLLMFCLKKNINRKSDFRNSSKSFTIATYAA